MSFTLPHRLHLAISDIIIVLTVVGSDYVLLS